jgi:hypothetical protein
MSVIFLQKNLQILQSHYDFVTANMMTKVYNTYWNGKVIHDELEVVLGEKLLPDFVLLGAKKFRKRICATQHLQSNNKVTRYSLSGFFAKKTQTYMYTTDGGLGTLVQSFVSSESTLP